MMVLISLKILALLWLVNFAPPLLAHFFEVKWDGPLDRGCLFIDKKPILGPHKTGRGVLGGIITGLLSGLILGFSWWVGLLSGVLSMLGDLLTSFIKRRRGMTSGKIVPGLDQSLEGLLPFMVLGPYCLLGILHVLVLVLFFGSGAYAGSWLLKEILLTKPQEDYPRRLRPRVRLRELRSCQIVSDPLRYFLNFEDAFYYHFIMKTSFRILGLYERGKQNALQVQKSSVTFYFPDLPRSFEGYRILYLSDLHLDGLDGLTEKVEALVRTLPVDLCVVGGDLRMETHGPYSEALSRFMRVLSSIQANDGILGILGNHDCLEFVKPLEREGVSFLINDARSIERNGDRIWFVGVDDPHYYKCHDLGLAFEGVPPDAFAIFLAHSNEIYREASRYFPRLYLCGHTHAGQIQIPPFGPIFTHSSAPRSLVQGDRKSVV